MVQERPVRVERRLSAILAADVAGYSRLMHSDEEETHAKLAALLTDAVDPAIADHGGRIVKSTGDGFLAEFPSAVEAVRAAVQFQSRIRELTTADAEEKRIAFRVGINVGDVIAEPHDIFGDGVNIAARLESIAEPGSICISSSAYDHVLGKVGVEFADLGEQNLKNIGRPVRAYAVIRDGLGPVTKGPGMTPSPHPAPRLSMVVLPFANIGSDPEQDYFADGVTESLTTDLSRIAGSFVIGSQQRILLQGQITRRTASRAGVERPLCIGRFGATQRQPAPSERAANRRRDRQPPVGRALRQARRRPVRYAGRNRRSACEYSKCSTD